ncbi:MAG: SDR family oxidoreductase [Gammaproteobacteria bacterium]|jgi:NAD(P)-dependent dehydrogenase (short-subunit alcohol dehydrogenase family)
MKLKDKIAIVTGGSQGIGEAICYAYAQEGATVIVVNHKNPAKGQEVATKINNEFDAVAKAYQCDITKPFEVDKLIQEVVTEFGTVDILVNNAGILIDKSFGKMTIEDWDKTMDVNLKSSFLMTKAVLPIMQQKKAGKIIFVASIAATHGFPNAVVYCASKGGMLMLAKSLAAEVAKDGINVNVISPGNTATAINQHLQNNPQFVENLKSITPTGRAYMNADEIAGSAVFLASENSSAIYGLDLIIDDGVSIL